MKIPSHASSLGPVSRAALLQPRQHADTAVGAREAGLPAASLAQAGVISRPDAALTSNAIFDIAAKVKANALAEHQRPYLDIVPDHLAEDIFAARDLDGDGALSSSESSLKSGLFKQLDVDGDGLISRSELTDVLRDRLEQLFNRKPDASVDAFMNKWMERFGLGAPVAASEASAEAQGIAVAEANGETTTVLPDASTHTNLRDASLGQTGGVLTMPPSTSVDVGSDTSVSLTALRATEEVGASTDAAGAGAPSAQPATAPTSPDQPRAGIRPLHTAGREYYAKVAAGLSEQLDHAGFADRPPTNIRDLVAGFGFDARGSSLLLKSLQAKYPSGLGVSVLG